MYSNYTSVTMQQYPVKKPLMTLAQALVDGEISITMDISGSAPKAQIYRRLQ